MSKLANKKVVIIGDSIGDETGKYTYVSYLKSVFQDATFINLAKNNATISDFDPQIPSMKRDQLPKAVKENPDCVIFMGGVNDYINQVPLKVVREAIEGIQWTIQSEVPKAMILYALTPLGNWGGQVLDFTANSQGYCVEEIRTSFKEIALLGGAAVVEVHKLACMNPHNPFSLIHYYRGGDDGVHPNENGSKRIGSIVANFINILF